MRYARLVAICGCLAFAVPSPASAELIDDPITCSQVELESQPGFSASVFESFLASFSDPTADFLEDENVSSVLVTVVEKCLEDVSDDHEQIAILALGIVGDQMLIEGRKRLRELDFDPSRFDDLFIPALREMPLDALDLLTFRPPDELRKPAFALRDEIIEKSGKSRSEVTQLLVTYTTGLVGVEAAQRVLTNMSKSP